jgi:hypothetical protein
MFEGCGVFMRRTSRAVLGLTAMTVALLSILGSGDARASALISNGVVQLGVNDQGNLNAEGRGVFYLPTQHDGTYAGWPSEGWGAGNADADPAEQFAGHANAYAGTTADGVSFTSTLATATSVSTVGAGRLEITHHYAPFEGNPSLMEGKVTLRNIGTSTLGDVRYTRLMDWDIEPTPFREFVTIRRGTTPGLLFSSDDGFQSGDPFGPRRDLAGGTTNVDVTDSGPNDHGALFDFGLGALAPGASTAFFIYYGAAATTDDADAAVSAAGAEVYSYGKPSDGDGQVENNLNTFIFAFRGLGGEAVIPPTLALSPKTATEVTGAPHTVTASLRDSADNPVPGSALAFSVAGANPHAASTATTGTDGTFAYTYTGTAPGSDTITACLDADDDGACGPTEVTDTATVNYQDATAPQTTIDSGPAAGSTTGDSTPTFVFGSSETGSTFACRIDDGEPFACTSALTLDALAAGAHTFSVTATDPSGNEDGSPASRRFSVSGPVSRPVPDPAPVTALPAPAPSAVCGSRRDFTIRLRPRRKRLVSAVVLVNGKRVKVRRDATGRLRARVDLTGLPSGSYRVGIDARARHGRRYKEIRTYKVC